LNLARQAVDRALANLAGLRLELGLDLLQEFRSAMRLDRPSQRVAKRLFL
jgi:hypothetical protein